MVTIDRRTRWLGRERDLDLDAVRAELPALLDANGAEANRSARAAGLAPLTLDVEGDTVTLIPGEQLEFGPNHDDAVVVQLDRAAFSDLVQGIASTFGVQMTGRANLDSSSVDSFLGWEPALRTLFDGRPAYVPGSIDFVDRDGRELDLGRSFRLDDDPAAIGNFLEQAGFLHIESVFTDSEMALVSAELDAAVAEATQDDGASWWARTNAGEWYPARILGFNRKSPTLRALMRSDRFAQIGRFTDDVFVQRDPDNGDSAEGLLKKVGVVEGISDVSWHKDCAMGGHSFGCCGLTVGISVTGAGKENGELGVVAGSHRANVVPLGAAELDLPKRALPTRTGDVTVHCSCTLHMSRPPVSAERRVAYTGFGLAMRDGESRAERDDDEIRRDRAALNDQTRRQQRDGGPSRLRGDFEL